MSIVVRSFAAVIVVSFCNPFVQAEWGNLTGRFVYDGPTPEPKFISTTGSDEPACGDKVRDGNLLVDQKTGGLANVVVYLWTKSPKIHPDYEARVKTGATIVMEQCQYKPHIVLLQVGQPMVWANRDKVAYAPIFGPPGEVGESRLFFPGRSGSSNFGRSWSSPQPVGCAIHAWMRAFVLCRDNPYMAVTKDDGSFDIMQLPAGEHEFQFWHEMIGPMVARPEWKKGRAKFTIRVGETTDLGEIKLDPKLFARE